MRYCLPSTSIVNAEPVPVSVLSRKTRNRTFEVGTWDHAAALARRRTSASHVFDRGMPPPPAIPMPRRATVPQLAMADLPTTSAPGKWRTVSLLALAELLAMSVWFSASAVVPQLKAEWGLTGAQQSWLTMSVQIGFVTGALLSAILNLADRIPAQRLIAGSAILAAAANVAIPLLGAGPASALVLRFLTGM